jgi:hypothetical protein
MWAALSTVHLKETKADHGLRLKTSGWRVAIRLSNVLRGYRPYCAWDSDMHERNADFLEGLDPDFFRYEADAHVKNLDNEHKQRAATALRTVYFHSLETLFALLFAIVQAPWCVYAWLLIYRLADLTALVGAVEDGSPIRHKLSITTLTWDSISRALFPIAATTESEELFARLERMWSLLAQDFLDSECRDEYNSIKHGLRSQAGAKRVALSSVDPNVQPSGLVPLGASDFGSSFLVLQELDPSRRNVFVRRHNHNWDPARICGRTHLVSDLLYNLRAFVLGHYGSNQAKFRFAAEQAAWDGPWECPAGLQSSSIDVRIEAADIISFTKEEILRGCPQRQ